MLHQLAGGGIMAEQGAPRAGPQPDPAIRRTGDADHATRRQVGHVGQRRDHAGGRIQQGGAVILEAHPGPAVRGGGDAQDVRVGQAARA
ncbi:hypothetical protein [Nitrospirillum amazonense]|uniref:hypothetical protein n=1 Tax=Nitrospirillum amazonense TaxID=28077 RepID=UPI0011AA0A2C|nr:hypothetical protein [Nitrospirillum amazonense]